MGEYAYVRGTGECVYRLEGGLEDAAGYSAQQGRGDR